jgi:hypothetical protein
MRHETRKPGSLPVVAVNPANKPECPHARWEAQRAEPTHGAKRRAGPSSVWAQDWDRVFQKLDRVQRQSAGQKRKEKYATLTHRVDVAGIPAAVSRPPW